MRSPGLGSQSRPAHSASVRPKPGHAQTIGARAWPEPEPGSGREPEGGVDTGHGAGVGSAGRRRESLAQCVTLRCSMPRRCQCHYHCHLSSPCGVECQCQEDPKNMPRRGILTSRCQVSLSAFLISESDWVIEVRWAPVSGAVGSEICYHYALCQTGTHTLITDSESSILFPPSQPKEGALNKYMRRRIQINIEISLAPDVCYIRLRLLIVCSGHLHILVPPPRSA